MVRPNFAATSVARTTHIGARVAAEDLQQVQRGTCNTRNKARKTYTVGDTDIRSSTSPQISENSSKLKRQISICSLFFFACLTMIAIENYSPLLVFVIIPDIDIYRIRE